MALLGSYIDVRTIASIQTGATATFAHGLPASPDFVIVVPSVTTASSASHMGIPSAVWDATNVTIAGNFGQVATSSLRVISVVAHSVIR